MSRKEKKKKMLRADALNAITELTGREAEIDKGHPVCNACGSKCCRYVIVEFPGKLKSLSDFDELRWLVAHKGVSIYKDCDGWHMLFETECEHLDTAGLCDVYAKRPEVCSGYENDDCEFVSLASGVDYHFRRLDDLDNYLMERFPRFKKKLEKKEKLFKKAARSLKG